MLPNHRPLVVAEQFGVLESLFPGRIDMGLGRSVGFTNGIRRALGVEKDAAEDFAVQVQELLGVLRRHAAEPPSGPRPPRRRPARPTLHPRRRRRRTPCSLARPPPGHRRRQSRVRPAAVAGPLPHRVPAVHVGSDGRTSYWQRLLRLQRPLKRLGDYCCLRRGPAPTRAPVACSHRWSRSGTADMTEKERGFFEQSLRGQIYGTPDEVDAALGGLVRRTARRRSAAHDEHLRPRRPARRRTPPSPNWPAPAAPSADPVLEAACGPPATRRPGSRTPRCRGTSRPPAACAGAARPRASHRASRSPPATGCSS